MNQTTAYDDGIPAEIDFSGGKRGRFHHSGARLHLPVHLKRQVRDRLATLANAKRVELSASVNELLKKSEEDAMTTVQITLPDELAQKADSAGLLSAEAMEAMLREQLRRRTGEAAQDFWQCPPAEEVTQEELERLFEELRQLLAERRRWPAK